MMTTGDYEYLAELLDRGKSRQRGTILDAEDCAKLLPLVDAEHDRLELLPSPGRPIDWEAIASAAIDYVLPDIKLTCSGHAMLADCLKRLFDAEQST